MSHAIGISKPESARPSPQSMIYEAYEAEDRWLSDRGLREGRDYSTCHVCANMVHTMWYYINDTQTALMFKLTFGGDL